MKFSKLVELGLFFYKQLCFMWGKEFSCIVVWSIIDCSYLIKEEFNFLYVQEVCFTRELSVDTEIHVGDWIRAS